jgi:hypothetical protein
MQLDDILSQTGGLTSIARELGISEQQVRAGAAALMPALVGGFAKQAQPSGAGGLGDLLGQLGGGSLLDNLVSPQPTDVGLGNNVLGNLFGSKDVSRTVAQHAAAQSGLEPSLLRKMLPLLAMLAVGYMAKRHGQARNAQKTGSTTVPATTPVDAGASSNGGASTNGGASSNGGGFGGLGDLLGGLLGGGGSNRSGGLGGLGAIFDKDGNGNPLDDILRKAGMRPR